MLGVAAHITAASPLGPRYDFALTKEQRSAPENGIWLCQNCAKLIDSDTLRFPSQILRHWKQSAEKLAFDNIGKSSLFSRISAPPIRYRDNPKLITATTDPRSLLETPPPPEATVELLAAGTTTLGTPYTVIGIGTNHQWDWEIFYLVQSEVGWQTMASIAFGGQKGHCPTVQYITGMPGALLVNHVGATGTGVFQKQSSLYRIGKTTAEPVMTFPTQFYVVDWGMPFDRHLTGKEFLLPDQLFDGAQFHMTYELAYYISATENEPDPEPLLHFPYSFDLIWNDEFGLFVPRTPNDDLSILDEAWNEDAEMFFARCKNDLLSLATSGSAAQKKFIHRHLHSV
jgi:hypothetical protein